MPDYFVTWEIEVDAQSHEHAAEIAREMQLDPDSTATVFRVARVGSHEDGEEIDTEKIGRGPEGWEEG